MTIDHARAIRNPRYAARKRAQLERHGSQDGAHAVDVLHDADGACCRREGWAATFARLTAGAIAAVSGAPPADVAALLAEHEPAAVVARPRAPRASSSRS